MKFQEMFKNLAPKASMICSIELIEIQFSGHFSGYVLQNHIKLKLHLAFEIFQAHLIN